MAPVEDVAAFIREHLDVELSPWQQEIANRIFSREPLNLRVAGRAGRGRTHLEQILKDGYRALGYEIVEGRGWWTAALPERPVVAAGDEMPVATGAQVALPPRTVQ